MTLYLLTSGSYSDYRVEGLYEGPPGVTEEQLLALWTAADNAHSLRYHEWVQKAEALYRRNTGENLRKTLWGEVTSPSSDFVVWQASAIRKGELEDAPTEFVDRESLWASIGLHPILCEELNYREV